ncbi:hypothetical protein WMY93_018552 [Mugilogobius chulae]|uniref:C2H2-type domain-containing protein n=1 Tax=Mugilogobius chulae TaxID=88201 RepID=A0AAW0NKH0_9GOBI
MACYYVVISSTHLRDGQLRSIKGVFRGPIGATEAGSEVKKGSCLYCELCDKQYERQQQYDNHTSSYDHHHRQRLKDLKQREFYRMLGSRRRRRDSELWPRSLHPERSSEHSVAGLGPMFRSTTVALDTAADEPDVFTSCTKDPVTTQVWSSTQRLSSVSSESDLPCTTSTDHETSQTNAGKPQQPHHCISPTPNHDAPPDATSNPHNRLWSDTRVSFALPKRHCVNQSAAVFLQTPKSKEKVTQTPPNMNHVDLDSSTDFKDPIADADTALKPTNEQNNDSPDNAKNPKNHSVAF